MLKRIKSNTKTVVQIKLNGIIGRYSFSVHQGLGSWKNLLTRPEKNDHVHNFEAIFIILDILEQDYLKFYESYE